MANELYRTYEVLVEESVHPDHPKRATNRTNKASKFNTEIDGALRDTHMIFQDAVCYNTLLIAGLAGEEELQDDEGELQPLNPLWKHLTTPSKQGGINEETEKIIRRLATHYEPFAGITTADEFLNRVYSGPLRIEAAMAEAEQTAVRQRRGQCYRILEIFGAPTKNGIQKCADMAEFKNNWAGYISDPDSDAEIPGNGAYDWVWRDLREAIKDISASDEIAEILNETLARYGAEGEKQNRADCEHDYVVELEKRKRAMTDAEALPNDDKKKPRVVKQAKARMEKWEQAKIEHDGKFFANRGEGLAEAVVRAFATPLAAKKGSDIGLSDDEFVTVKQRIAKIGASPETRRAKHIRLHYKGGAPGNFEKAMFRYWVLRENSDPLVKQAALADFRWFIFDNDPTEEPTLDGKHIEKMPFEETGTTFAFPYFGKQSLDISTAESSPDPEFDKVAFTTAAEDVFKYKIRTDIRKARVAKLLNVLQAYEEKGTTLRAEESPTGKPLTVRGMDGDPRWNCDQEDRKGIVQLLAAMSKDKEIGGYGLRSGTIGGWAEVRKAFLRIYRKALKDENAVLDEPKLTTDLEKAVDDEMEANRQGFGSADFFHKLCEPAFFHLWLGDKKDNDGNIVQKYEHNGIRDFIPHYVGYCEWREELIGLLMQEGADLDWRSELELSATKLRALAARPIRYTWPGLLNRHKKPSYRYYDFAQNLNTILQLKSLFRRVRTTGVSQDFPTYKKLTGDDSKLTLAARRLKRDKIVNKDTGSSVDALWCPPLILEGESEPTAATKPKAGKEKKKDSDPAEVSFSLIASPLPGDYWNEVAGVPSANREAPVHLTVSFKIEGDETAKLRAETKQWLGGSHRGFAKKGEKDADKRKHFNWPIDKDTSKFEAEKPDEKPKQLWCGNGIDGSVWQGFAFRRDKKASGTEGAVYYENDFHILSVDLGNRFAAAFTRLRIHEDSKGEGRVISAEGFLPAIKADVTRQGTLRLQGENAKVWDHVLNGDGTCKTDENEKYVYALEDEKYGNAGRGRFPTGAEYDVFKKLADRLVVISSLSVEGTKKQTYPELGDHLVFRLKRRIGRLRTLLNLIWRLRGTHERNNKTGRHDKLRSDADRFFHRQMTVETLARSKFPKRRRQQGEVEEPGDISLRDALAPDGEWQKLKNEGLLENLKGKPENDRRKNLQDALKDSKAWNWDKLADAVGKQIEENFNGTDSLNQLLVDVVEFCLPLRARHWRWNYSPNGERLAWGAENEDPDCKPNVMGMRGLSMKRLEQILNLRQRCQSYAKLENRYHQQFKIGNFNPPDSTRDELPDSCPKLLERSNRIREQRVDQTAHLILAEALGMELKNPVEVENKKSRKNEVDLHGEYKRRTDKNGKDYPRCSVIVLENLERYKTSQERTKVENSRLMRWAHRAIIEKLEDMCRPFGITLMLVDPAFSSHFDARTGLPGVRVEEVSRDFEQTYPYNRWVEGKKKSGGETRLAEDIKKLVDDFGKHLKYKGTLLVAVEGGSEFLPVLTPKGIEPGPINSDICAAGNIGFRGIADPQLWDIFSRLRTKQISEDEVSVTNWRGWFGKFLKDSEHRRMRRATAEVGQRTASKQKKKTKTSTPTDSDESATEDSQPAESSEYPPFFVAHPKYDWGIGLQDKAFKFVQNGQEVLAYPQGAYLKRVEHVCAQRIRAINDARLKHSDGGQEDEEDKIPM